MREAMSRPKTAVATSKTMLNPSCHAGTSVTIVRPAIENGDVSGTIETIRAKSEFGAGSAMKAEMYPITMKTMSGPTAALMSSWRLSIDATPA